MLTIQPSDGFEKYLFDKAFSEKVPIGGTIELLPICNMDCKMCYIKTSVNEMNKMGRVLTVEEWIEIVKQLKDNGTLFLLLTGGEPLLYKDFKKLYKAIISMGIIVTINTNGTLINDEFVTLFHEYPPRRINISLYGASAQTYEKVCGYSKGYELTINAIKKLVDAKVPVKVNFTLNKNNKNDLFKVIKITEDLNIPISIPTYMFPPVRKPEDDKHFSEYRLSPKEVAQVQYEIAKYGLHEEPLSIESVKRTLNKIDEKNCLSEHKDPPGGFLCSAGVRSFWINWQGILTPCGMVPQPQCDLKEYSFKDGWNKMIQKSTNVYTATECFNCRFRSICQNCAASSLAENGQTDTKVTYHCESCKEYERLLKKLVNEEKNNENK